MRVALGPDPLDPGALLAEVAASASGASVLFVGTVRETNDGRTVSGMEYSAYAAMACRELAAIATEAVERWHAERLVVGHRVGTLAVGEASVVIAVSHAHRGPAYDASRYVIDELKRRVPIWKREHYLDGTREWIDPTGHGAGAERGAGSPAARGASAAAEGATP